MSLDWVAVVPARAGSVGIPGKNRRYVGGMSLAEQAIRRALLVTPSSRVVVTTDDPFVARIGSTLGCVVVDRPANLADGEATIAQAVDHAIIEVGACGAPVAVFQPTSPALRDETVIEALAEFGVRDEWQSLALAVEDPHLMWHLRSDGQFGPVYEQRVNRQYREDTLYRETGGLMLVRAWDGPLSLVSDSGHHLWTIDPDEAIDVDTPLDLAMAERAATRSLIEWRIVAGQSVGYGHLFRCLALAAEMPHHLHRWIVDGPEEARAIVGAFYPVASYGATFEYAPDIVVFDCLNVAAHDYDRARTEGAVVVGIELVEVPEHAHLDLYVDELATPIVLEPEVRAHIVKTGPAYASIRDEYRAARVAVDEQVHTQIDGRVLVTFGGEDPGRFTERVLEALYGRYDVRAVIGPGFAPEYAHRLREAFPDAIIESQAMLMSDLMLAAEMVITATGRSVWEAAYLGCSIITIPVNDRERDHAYPAHARRIPGYDLDAGTLRMLVDIALAEDNEPSDRLDRALRSAIDGHGPRRVAWLIDGVVSGLA